MDFATLLGLVIAVGAVGGSYLLEGGNLEAIFLTAPMMIVIGGTLGATTITTSFDTVRQIPHYLKVATWNRSISLTNTIDRLVQLAEKARREGILGLESDLKTIEHPFFRKAIRLVIDGTDLESLRDILEMEIVQIEERHKRGISFFKKAGGFAPTMGILGTVLGLIHTLGSTSDASKMATHIAAAFIATLWGVGLANLFFLPLSDKLRMRHEEELTHLELITEGVLAIQTGENPRNIRTKLLSFIAPTHRFKE
ncbi:MAG: flagellar motor protein [Candidatus Zixiibacteriota bacterium]|nr:MAG: flagellar motor protein [candidate division Zixibacteria bacterium]